MQTYCQTPSQSNLLAFLSAVSAFWEPKDTIRNTNWEEFLQSIDAHSSVREVYDIKSKPTNPLITTQLFVLLSL